MGEYRILEPVGEGGMGVVYRGVQPVIKKRVAIKVIKPAFASDESQVNRLVAEAEAVNAIGHRSIIDIFSLGALPDGRPYIIMEFLDGEPLDVWLNRQGTPPLIVALELLVEMCGPLAAAHRAGVIHRDLKPSNIFLCSQPDGSKFLKLLDFGLAKRAMGLDGSSAQTSHQMVSGTPDYMAPEQARGMSISPRSDIYALGIVAFELLTGRVPFIGATPMDVMVGHVSTPAPRLRTFEPALPFELDELVARMMAKEPEQRPQTIEEVRAVLEEVLVAGGSARPRPSQTNLRRLSGFDGTRPATPAGPLKSVQTPAVPQPASAPLPLPTGEPVPVVVGTVMDSAKVAAAQGDEGADGPTALMTSLAEATFDGTFAPRPSAPLGAPLEPFQSAPAPVPRKSAPGTRPSAPFGRTPETYESAPSPAPRPSSPAPRPSSPGQAPRPTPRSSGPVARTMRSTPGPGSPAVRSSMSSLAPVEPPPASRVPFYAAGAVLVLGVVALVVLANLSGGSERATPGDGPTPSFVPKPGTILPPTPKVTPEPLEVPAPPVTPTLTVKPDPVEPPPDDVVQPGPVTDRFRPKKKVVPPPPPTTEALIKRISRLESIAQRRNLGPNASSLLETYRLQVTAADSASEREALARKLDGWEEAFLGK